MITGKVFLTLCRLFVNSFAPREHLRLKWKEYQNIVIMRNTRHDLYQESRKRSMLNKFSGCENIRNVLL